MAWRATSPRPGPPGRLGRGIEGTWHDGDFSHGKPAPLRRGERWPRPGGVLRDREYVPPMIEPGAANQPAALRAARRRGRAHRPHQPPRAGRPGPRAASSRRRSRFKLRRRLVPAGRDEVGAAVSRDEGSRPGT
ncbi:hypothetical protein HBB16_12875 [Pseudonocardia sp. MCCB 268]|nr:hypothetical protein [Pseudonocardia cytotoxica]